jgi:peptidyl-prolyl cis-trans isomerase D
VKAGGDFAELAKKHSEDSSAPQGGDLDYFGRGRMVKEFDDVAFSLAPGSTSDLVKTQFGYHIIKVVDKKAAATRPLAEVSGQIADQLQYERAQAQAAELATTLAKEIKTPADLDAAAKKRGLTVQESGFFTRDEPIMGIGPAPDVSEQAFTVKDGEVAGPLRTARGPVFLTAAGKQEPRVPALAEVKDKVKDDATRARARELSKARAESLAADFRADFAAAAKKAGLEVKTTELVARGSTLPEVGINAAVDQAVFALPAGSVTGPVVTDAGTVIARVVEKQSVTAADLAAGKDGVRSDLQNERRNRFFSAYMLKAKDKIKPAINQDVVRRVVG